MFKHLIPAACVLSSSVAFAEPTANANGPYLAAVSSSIALNSTGSVGNTLVWTAAAGGTVNQQWLSAIEAVYSFTAGSEAGIFDVCLTANPGTLDSDQACTIVVVYDPSAGFVTGSGSIDSPAGAYRGDVSLSGKATFGFISKYKKGANVPTGHTEFKFRAAGFNFYSDTYEWLVVNNGGANAQFKGEGTVNGNLDSNQNAYKFMIWAGDDSPDDTFQIKIWSELDRVETVVYDNGFAQQLAGGKIIIHASKSIGRPTSRPTVTPTSNPTLNPTVPIHPTSCGGLNALPLPNNYCSVYNFVGSMANVIIGQNS